MAETPSISPQELHHEAFYVTANTVLLGFANAGQRTSLDEAHYFKVPCTVLSNGEPVVGELRLDDYFAFDSTEFDEQVAPTSPEEQRRMLELGASILSLSFRLPDETFFNSGAVTSYITFRPANVRPRSIVSFSFDQKSLGAWPQDRYVVMRRTPGAAVYKVIPDIAREEQLHIAHATL